MRISVRAVAAIRGLVILRETREQGLLADSCRRLNPSQSIFHAIKVQYRSVEELHVCELFSL